MDKRFFVLSDSSPDKEAVRYVFEGKLAATFEIFARMVIASLRRAGYAEYRR